MRTSPGLIWLRIETCLLKIWFLQVKTTRNLTSSMIINFSRIMSFMELIRSHKEVSSIITMSSVLFFLTTVYFDFRDSGVPPFLNHARTHAHTRANPTGKQIPSWDRFSNLTFGRQSCNFGNCCYQTLNVHTGIICTQGPEHWVHYWRFFP